MTLSLSHLKNFVSKKCLYFNPLNTELNPICHFLALLGGATIVVVSRLRVNKTSFHDFVPFEVISHFYYWYFVNSWNLTLTTDSNVPFKNKK
jgi:hypothetical protein